MKLPLKKYYTTEVYNCYSCDERFITEIEAEVHEDETGHNVEEERIVKVGGGIIQTLIGILLIPLYILLWIPYVIYLGLKRLWDKL